MPPTSTRSFVGAAIVAMLAACQAPSSTPSAPTDAGHVADGAHPIDATHRPPDGAAPPAMSGTLDPTFGVNGWVQVDLSWSGDHFYDVAETAAGDLVAVGETERVPETIVNPVLWLRRFHGDGAVDPSFGVGGDVRITGASGEVHGRAVVTRSDGDAIAVANALTPTPANGGNFDLMVAGVSATGALDPAFGSAGLVDGGANGTGIAIAATPDGDVVVVEANAIVRLHADGSIVSSFGSAGRIATSIPAVWQSQWSFAQYVAQRATVLPDGTIVVAGTTQFGDDEGLVVAEYDADGAPVAGFGEGGVQIAAVGGFAATVLGDLAVQADGKIVVVGTDQHAGAFFAMRFDGHGQSDPSFGSGGLAQHLLQRGSDPTGTQGIAVASQADGKLVIVCDTDIGVGVVRLTTSGAVDGSFGDGQGDGWTVINELFWGLHPSAVIIERTGRIIIAGAAQYVVNAFENWDAILIGLRS